MGDVVGGLLIADAIQQSQQNRALKQLLAADEAAWVADREARLDLHFRLRRSRPPILRAMLLLERSWRAGIRQVMFVLDEAPGTEPITLANRDTVAAWFDDGTAAGVGVNQSAVAILWGAVALGYYLNDSTVSSPQLSYVRASSESVREIWQEAATRARIVQDVAEAVLSPDVSAEALATRWATYVAGRDDLRDYFGQLRGLFIDARTGQAEWEADVPDPWANENPMYVTRDPEDYFPGDELLSNRLWRNMRIVDDRGADEEYGGTQGGTLGPCLCHPLQPT